MKVTYKPVTEKEWLSHIQKGGGFKGLSYQRGAGLGSVFRSLFRAILPIAKSAGKAVGKRALKAGANIATDIVSGKPLKESLKQNGKEAAADLLEKGTKKLRGGKLGTIKGARKGRVVKRRAVKPTNIDV